MNSNDKLIHRQLFIEGQNTVLSPLLMKNTQYAYALNCDVMSSDEGNQGVISNVRGTFQVAVDLPTGENLCIGTGLDEESNSLYFAVWNSNGYHTWFQFDSVSRTVKRIFQDITDTKGASTFNWQKDRPILHINIISKNLLYWAVGTDHARKINISKALDKSENGYGPAILDEFTRAYKKTSPYAPEAEYFTNRSILNNSVYGYQFRFATQYIYDDFEESVFSDFSRVPNPVDENYSADIGIPLTNNGIKVRFLTGSKIVSKVRVAMQKTNNEGGASEWVSVFVLDKKKLNIPDDTEYEYEFYNNSSYLALPPGIVDIQQSDLPRNPELQEYINQTLVYGNFPVGRPPVEVDMSVNVTYEDLFIPSETSNQLNNPSVVVNFIDGSYESGGFLSGGGWRHTLAEVIIGPDVKKGNVFRIVAKAGSLTKFDYQVVANANDTASTIAAQFLAKISNNSRVKIEGGYTTSITTDNSGFAKFRFNFVGGWKEDYLSFTTYKTPVYFNTLKNTGSSVVNDKLGAAFRYGLYYEDDDGRKTLVFGNDQLVEIKTINELGSIKKVVTRISINHRPPEWASKVAIVRTKNLRHLKFIDILIQNIVSTTNTTSGEKYYDLSLGGLYTYQQVHTNSTLAYEFQKGDRVRFVKLLTGSTESVPTNVIDYEVMNFYPTTTEDVLESITVDGTNQVTATVDVNNIGNNIVINGAEREIVGVSSGKYLLNSAIGTSGSPETFPSYQIINKRGVIRIKMNDEYPITINPESNIYPIVEIYRPYQAQSNAENENYFNTGYKFDIQNGFHLGNIQNQTQNQPAIIQINGMDNYVRNREFITNNSVKNPNIVIGTIEDDSFSDFYVSDLSSYGRATFLDNSSGEVQFGDRLVWALNYIEGTKINGLNMFLNLNRVDYSDKYGSIMRIMFHEGRLYIFKFLKTGWVAPFANVITDDTGQELLATSTNVLPEKMQYFLWEGGVGNNPESVVRDGNDFFGVSANSGVIFRIGGNGVLPVSKIFGIDNEARDLVTSASKSGVRMFGSYNRKKDNYVLMIPAYDKVAYIDLISELNYRLRPIAKVGAWNITSAPAHGTASVNSDRLLYAPNINYSGMDYVSYRAGTGVVRQICINVLSADTQFVWRPSGQFCVLSAGVRTGFMGYTTLNQYDNISQSYTGVTKPNADTDPDYVEPIENLNVCPLGAEFINLGTLFTNIQAQTITFDVTSEDDFNIVIKQGSSFSNVTIDETGMVSSGEHQLTVPFSSQGATLYLVVDGANYDGVTKFTMLDAFISGISFSQLPMLEELRIERPTTQSIQNNILNSLDVSSNTELTKIIVKHHQLSSIDLRNLTNLTYIDVSYGYSLTSLQINPSTWEMLSTLAIHESKFTSEGYSPAYINSVLATLNANSTGGVLLQYGLGTNFGVIPSTTALTNYNQLIGKGWNVIGRKPVSMSATVTMEYTREGANMVRFRYFLSTDIDADITIEANYKYTTSFGENNTGSFPNKTIPRGSISTPYDVTEFYINDNDTNIITSGKATILLVTPNPAGSYIINITQPS